MVLLGGFGLDAERRNASLPQTAEPLLGGGLAGQLTIDARMLLPESVGKRQGDERDDRSEEGWARFPLPRRHARADGMVPSRSPAVYPPLP